MVILDDDDFADLPSSSSREIAVEKFVPREQIDPIWFEKSYYLEPEKSGTKPYALLRQALLDADRMAVVTVAIRNRTSMAVLRVRDEVIVLQTMMWPDEVRAAEFNVETGRRQARRGQDGQHAGRDARRRLRRQRVRGRLRRGRRGPGEGQDRGRRGQEDPDVDQVLGRGRRPAGCVAAVGRRGQDRTRRVDRRRQGREEAGQEVQREEVHSEEGRCQEVRRRRPRPRRPPRRPPRGRAFAAGRRRAEQPRHVVSQRNSLAAAAVTTTANAATRKRLGEDAEAHRQTSPDT